MATYLENIGAQAVRDLTGLTTADLSDANIVTILSGAVATLNNDIQIRYEDWQVVAIDSWRENKIDNSNKVFYIPDYMRPIGDYNDDGKIDTSDVEAYVIRPTSGDSSYSKISISISTITDDKYGKVTLVTAPTTSDQLYLSWSQTPLQMTTPHNLIKRAIIQLGASVCYSRLDVNKVSSFRVGKVAIMKQSDAFRKYMSDYRETVNQIKSRAVRRKDHDTLIYKGKFLGEGVAWPDSLYRR